MSRNVLGVLAAILLVLGAITAIAGPGGTSASTFAGGCIRVGLVLGALWLALPQIRAMIARTPGWALGWFAGKGKDRPTAAKGESEAPPVRRPRRRGRG
jgi:hypothetical protein